MVITKRKSTISSTRVYSNSIFVLNFHVYRIGSWFQFNDETVTPIKCLGDNVPKKLPKADEE
jgi:hypothetical protein